MISIPSTHPSICIRVLPIQVISTLLLHLHRDASELNIQVVSALFIWVDYG